MRKATDFICILVSGQDFNSVSANLRFAACKVKSSCATVSIIDDLLLEEPTEEFEVALVSSSDTRINVNTVPSIVYIDDNDGEFCIASQITETIGVVCFIRGGYKSGAQFIHSD